MNDIFWVNKIHLAIGPYPNSWAGLYDACRAVRKAGVDVLVSLQTENEAAALGLSEEDQAAIQAGLMFHRFGITDHQPPPFTPEVFDFVSLLADHLDSGQRVLIHCYAGIGRSATIAAGVLIERGYSPQAAVRALTIARGLPVPETEAQLEWISKFAQRFNP